MTPMLANLKYFMQSFLTAVLLTSYNCEKEATASIGEKLKGLYFQSEGERGKHTISVSRVIPVFQLISRSSGNLARMTVNSRYLLFSIKSRVWRN